MKKYFIIALSLLLVCCTSTNKTEIHQVNRDKVVKVKEKLTEIIGDEAVLGGRSRSCIVNDYLLFEDTYSLDTTYYIFDKNTFQ